MDKLERYLETPAGRQVNAVLDLDFALQAGITITLRDLDALQLGLLRVLAEERNIYQREEAEKSRSQQGALKHGE